MWFGLNDFAHVVHSIASCVQQFFLDAAPLNIIVPTVTERPSRSHFAPWVSEDRPEGESASPASFFASPPFERSRCAK